MTDKIDVELRAVIGSLKRLTPWELEKLRSSVALEHANRMAAYEASCEEEGEVPCNVITGHRWVTSDENEEDCYCENCGCREY